MMSLWPRLGALLLAACCWSGTVVLTLEDCRLTAARVYTKLTRVANGVGIAPKLRVQSEKEFRALRGHLQSTNRVAYLDVVNNPPVHREIVIDERTIRVCAGLGSKSEDCVAFFLGHELAHWANSHDWKGHFARKMGVAQQDLKASESQDRESEADDLGMLYGALAGYDALGVSARALAGVYKAYSIPADLPGYLRLSDRQAISRKSEEYLARMLPLFDAATLLLATGKYRESAICYDAILETFPSREVFNNAAVARAFAAITAGNNRKEFDLPWMLDTATRLPAAPVARAEGNAESRATLLAEARRDLEEALRRDPEYKPAHANLGLVLHLEGGDADEVALHLKKAGVKLGDFLQSSPTAVKVQAAATRSELYWQGKRPRDSSPSTHPIEMRLSDDRKLWFAATDTYRWFRYSMPRNKRMDAVTVLAASEGFLKSLGTPDREFSAIPGRVLLFERLGVMVILDSDGKVQRYTVYEES